ncbi:pyridoxamine 5'-phosphate oxidase family protein [Fimbriiglobus ruber]|uniref:Pyridoxamine 5'-phosphate oxidase-related, FMN-binding n=1 Tax=Fimbriiglobus ruber TaxID=1908690 RepID=A0A225DCH8_9BACT|nr:pyridoxamine 5'-phosphate oxidase family protein [Fimbriiglobus ruber]OWK37344.1 Pyridoxamine 5'-phosphate oxidase-related, FMN-binding [Fimbriiglobus ruber]
MIREISRQECLQVLSGTRLARLACARENQPYIVPVYLVYDEASGYLYGYTTPGQKVEWMRANPLVCVEVDLVTAYDRWVSIIAFGRYEELPEGPGSDDAMLRAPERPRQTAEVMPALSVDHGESRFGDGTRDEERERAWQILSTNPFWGEPALAAWKARAHRDPAEPFASVYYRIRIDRVTGHEATRDAVNAISDTGPAPPAPAAASRDRQQKAITRAFGDKSEAIGPTS